MSFLLDCVVLRGRSNVFFILSGQRQLEIKTLMLDWHIQPTKPYVEWKVSNVRFTQVRLIGEQASDPVIEFCVQVDTFRFHSYFITCESGEQTVDSVCRSLSRQIKFI